MNHEFWNEIGNLYFMCGAYEPAIHAYLNSIKLDNTFGRSYNNLAMAYVQTGKYRDAIKLYLRSIELLADQKEKATTWNRLGILYRQIKEYDNALEAYHRADLIAPQEDAEEPLKSHTDANLPLTVSMPEIELDMILAKGGLAKWQTQNDLLAEINAEFEAAEVHPEAPIFDESSTATEFENYFEPNDASLTPPSDLRGEWKLAYAEEVAPGELALPQPAATPDQMGSADTIAPVAAYGEAPVENTQINEPALETQTEPGDLSESDNVNEVVDAVESTIFFENNVVPESVETVTSETSVEATQYSQVEYPLTDVSPEERQALELNIIKYQQATSKNPRSYILWEGLGDAHKSAGQYRDAIQAFQKAISLNPASPRCHYRLGLVYAAERKEQEAIKSFKKVLELDPTSAQAHASLASQYRKMGLEKAAQEHIEKARGMELEEESDYNRACLEAICGNNERALELLEVALQSKQTYIAWAQNDPDFDALRKDHRFQVLLSSHATTV
jgi:tetratricopeptide (TPR) repeat protein